MADLTTAQWAPLQDGNGANLFPANYATVSSDASVASVGLGTDGVIAIIGQGAGTAAITCTRNSDSAVATLDVTVEAVAPNEFTIQLGAPVAR